MKNRKKPSNRPLTFESLEARLPLAGEVLLKVSGGTLSIKGDELANGLFIEQQATAGEFKVTQIASGGAATTFKLNGAVFNSGDIVKGVTKDIKVDLKKGDDVIQIFGLGQAGAATARNIDVKTGAGLDQVQIITANVTGKVSINTGSGDGNGDNDLVNVNQVKIAKTLSITTGKGADAVTVTGGEVVANATIKTGDQGDTVSTAGAQKFNKNLTINTGTAVLKNSGPPIALVDTVNINNATKIIGNTSITTGNGNDVVNITSATAAKVTLKTGKGNDDVNIAGAAAVTIDQALVNLGAGDDTIDIFAGILTLNGPKITKINGGAGNDKLTSGAGANLAGAGAKTAVLTSIETEDIP